MTNNKTEICGKSEKIDDERVMFLNYGIIKKIHY
jgi:hypothetical protein